MSPYEWSALRLPSLLTSRVGSGRNKESLIASSLLSAGLLCWEAQALTGNSAQVMRTARAVAALLASSYAVIVGPPVSVAAADQGPVLTDAARAVVAAEVARSDAGESDSAAAERARVASRVVFQNLSSEQALEALLAAEPGVLSRPGWLQAPSLTPMAYATPLDTNLLSVDGGAGPDSVVWTSQPVAFRDSGGDFRKIDLALQRGSGGDLVPQSSPFALSLPARLDQGISVGDGTRHFSIAPEVSSGSQATVDDYAAFYGDVAPDTDFVAKPVLDGVETYSVLRSAASPEVLKLHLSGGANSSLRAASPAVGGGYLLAGGGEDVAAISPPQAWDAQNRPVPVETSIDGNDLVLHVDHRDRDVAYPIVVDPTVVDTCWSWVAANSGCQVDAWETDTTGTYNSGTAGWAFEGPSDGRFAPYAGPGYLGNGLYIRNLANNYFTANEAGDWYYRAPSGVRIWSAQFANLSQDNLADNMSCLFVGVLENTGAWGTGSPRTFCAQQSLDQSWTWCPGTSCSDQSGGTPGNAAIFGAMAQHTGWSSYWMDDMGGVAIAMTEMNWASLNPYISSPDFPDSWQTSPSNIITFHIGDAGLGIRSIAFSSPENPTWQAVDADTGGAASRTYTCTGGMRLACPMDVWIHMKLGNLQEGYSTIRVKVTDMVGKTYTYEHAIAIQYYWASAQYGGANGVVDSDSEVQSVVNAMAATTASGRQALWAGLDPTSRSYYVNDLLPQAKAVRADFGLDASDATTQAVFNDPTTHGTIADLGTPLTSTEYAQVSSDSAPGTLSDGNPSSDLLSSTYQVQTYDGDPTASDSTGNIGCDQGTETGCPDAGAMLTDSTVPASDPTTDDLSASSATASEASATQAGAASSWFNRYGARADADAHALSPRTGLYAPFNDSDCTNFVSQVWHFGGGLRMTGKWRIRWMWPQFLGRTNTRSWSLVRDFVNYMVNTRQIARLINLNLASFDLPSSAGLGDAIEYDWGRGAGWSHLAVVVSTAGTNDRISQHSVNRRESLWDLGWVNETSTTVRANMRARVVHVRVQ